jgi:hypothetical protein
MRRLAYACIITVLSAMTLHAQNANLGTAGALFLKIPVGARPAALGGAFTSCGESPDALFWNPAGVVSVKGSALAVSHEEWWAGSRLNHAAFVQSFPDIGSFGLSFTSMSMDKIAVTTEEDPEGTSGQTFDAQDLMLGISYARQLTDDFSVGLTAKYVHQRIWNENASGVAVDIGTLYRIPFRDLTLGMSVTNFGGDLSFEGRDLLVDYDVNSGNSTERLLPAQIEAEGYPLPLHFQVGLSVSPYISDELSVLVAADVVHPNDNDEIVCAGIEAKVFQRLALRGGYRFGDDTARWSAGVGASVPAGGNVNVGFDYAYVAYDLLPAVHRFGIALAF